VDLNHIWQSQTLSGIATWCWPLSANWRDGTRIAGAQQICEDNSIDGPANIRFRSALMLHVEVPISWQLSTRFRERAAASETR